MIPLRPTTLLQGRQGVALRAPRNHDRHGGGAQVHLIKIRDHLTNKEILRSSRRKTRYSFTSWRLVGWLFARLACVCDVPAPRGRMTVLWCWAVCVCVCVWVGVWFFLGGGIGRNISVRVYAKGCVVVGYWVMIRGDDVFLHGVERAREGKANCARCALSSVLYIL